VGEQQNRVHVWVQRFPDREGCEPGERLTVKRCLEGLARISHQGYGAGLSSVA